MWKPATQYWLVSPPFHSDESAASNVPASSPATSASDLSEGESESEPTLDPPQEEAASRADASAESAGNALAIELPAGVYVPPARPSEAASDRRSYDLPLNPGGARDDEADPVDQIFPPEWRLPVHAAAAGSGVPRTHRVRIQLTCRRACR